MEVSDEERPAKRQRLDTGGKTFKSRSPSEQGRQNLSPANDSSESSIEWQCRRHGNGSSSPPNEVTIISSGTQVQTGSAVRLGKTRRKVSPQKSPYFQPSTAAEIPSRHIDPKNAGKEDSDLKARRSRHHSSDPRSSKKPQFSKRKDHEEQDDESTGSILKQIFQEPSSVDSSEDSRAHAREKGAIMLTQRTAIGSSADTVHEVEAKKSSAVLDNVGSSLEAGKSNPRHFSGRSFPLRSLKHGILLDDSDYTVSVSEHHVHFYASSALINNEAILEIPLHALQEIVDCMDNCLRLILKLNRCAGQLDSQAYLEMASAPDKLEFLEFTRKFKWLPIRHRDQCVV